ncbi:MAG: pyridoxal phosphate-dependent aminotransferase [Pseudomonadota bacterium]
MQIPKLKIDNRLGSPDPQSVPLNVHPENMPPELLLRREIDYVADNIAPFSCRKAISDAHNALYQNGSLTPDHIMVSAGATMAATPVFLYMKELSALEGRYIGARSILISPHYSLYKEANDLLGIETEFIKPEKAKDERDIIAKLQKLCNDSHRNSPLLLLLVNPNNPDGHIYSKDFMYHLLKLMGNHPNLHVLHDTVYEKVTPSIDGRPRKKVLSLFKIATEKMQKRIFEVSSLSKNIGYPGLRGGWLISDKNNIKHFTAIFDPVFGQIPADTYLAIEAILSKDLPQDEQMDPAYYKNMNKVYYNKMSFLVEALKSISYNQKTIRCQIPDGGFYLWSDFSPLVGDNPHQAQKLVKDIISEAKSRNILLKDGKSAGGAGYMRFNCAAPANELDFIAHALIDISQKLGFHIDQSKRKTELISHAEMKNLVVRSSSKNALMRVHMRQSIEEKFGK